MSGKVRVGKGGVAIIWFYIGGNVETVVLTPGKDGIKPNTWYQLDKNNKPVEVEAMDRVNELEEEKTKEGESKNIRTKTIGVKE